MSTTMFVRHQVKDFQAWHTVYQDLPPMQKALGVTAQAVYRSADDPNDVTVTHEFASLEAARAYVGSPELRAAMDRAGVAGPPTIWFANPA